MLMLYVFQFTHPGRGATTNIYLRRPSTKVSIHAPREGCDSCFAPVPHLGNNVSIHAPREGCDRVLSSEVSNAEKVSIHAPREGCDHEWIAYNLRHLCFNSRTPGGVRLASNRHQRSETPFQFTHPGRGATHDHNALPDPSWSFNSRTPGGVRLRIDALNRTRGRFQFTHPGRGATPNRGISVPHLHVSIHAPREGCDSVVQSCVLWDG